MAIGTTTQCDESRFAKIKPVASGGAFALAAKYQHDADPDKVDLLIGAYRDNNGKPWQLPSVMEAKRRMNIESQRHEYLPLQGNPDFLHASRQLVFGSKILKQEPNTIASIQTVSGTGANSLIAQFLQRHTNPRNIWLPNPTWANHHDIWQTNAPGVHVQYYPYYDAANKKFDFAGLMLELQNKAQKRDAILFHACAHNPTGLDPTQDEWRQIALLCKSKKVFVIFDLAYQGFASGDLDLDAWAIRHFFSHRDIEIAVCQSFSKNLGLYGERTGALHLVVSRNSPSRSASVVQDHLVNIHRATVSMAPRFGSEIATAILMTDDLRQIWNDDLIIMSGRIKEMRQALYGELVRLETPGSWEHIVMQTGMFSYLGLSADQVDVLRKKYHVYMLPCGRVSICGLTTANIKYVAQAIDQVVRSIPESLN
ncbi:pyridoxal phosphate-dependent transferase [Aspergillus venezuelensis]